MIHRIIGQGPLIVASLHDQAYGAFFESVALLQMEMSAIRWAVLDLGEEMAGLRLQSGSVVHCHVLRSAS